MKKFKVEIVRKSQWTFEEVEAKDADEAKEKAEYLADNEVPNDSWSYSAKAWEV